jgi:hypothetical protein
METTVSAISDPIRLLTEKHGRYERFIHFVRYPQAIRAFFVQSALLRSGLRVLDAGCGTGIVTLAVRDALRLGLTPGPLHAFRPYAGHPRTLPPHSSDSRDRAS